MQITLRPVALVVAPAARPRSSHFAPSILGTLKLWRARSRSRRHLARLDDRDLADIGITHAEQLLECNKPFWRG
jgi:uncharacterized protein YjiS (DUF1127 family)